MILDNYWKFLQAVQQNATTSLTTPNTGTVATDGSNTNIIASGGTDAGYKNKAVKELTGIVVGTGDTAVDSNDYSLASDVTSSLSNTATTKSMVFENGKLKTVFTFTANNYTGNTLTIKEVGIVKQYYYYAYEATFNKNMLFARKLLDSPLEVPNNTGFIISFVWEEN